MKARAFVVGAVAILLAAACVRMGLWQLSRWNEKRALARDLSAALAAPAVPLPSDPGAWPAARARRVIATGAFDPRWQLLLSDRWRGDSAGVELLSPARLAGGNVVLVDRGWLASNDGIHARLPAEAETGPQTWTALLEPLPPHAKTPAWERLPADSVRIYSARALGADSLRARSPYAIWPWVLRALPDPVAPALPSRERPEPPNAMMHLSYAVQWFLFATAFLAGWWFVLRRSRPPGAGDRG